MGGFYEGNFRGAAQVLSIFHRAAFAGGIFLITPDEMYGY
jgi:hypothetical protein